MFQADWKFDDYYCEVASYTRNGESSMQTGS